MKEKYGRTKLFQRKSSTTDSEWITMERTLWEIIPGIYSIREMQSAHFSSTRVQVPYMRPAL